MSAYIFGSSKKPLNMLDNPISPNIRKDALRFTWSRKYWKVDSGDAIKETELYPFFVEGIVTHQSRNRNETVYGKSSHRDYVNQSIRLPLVAPVDLLPLSRTPRPPVTPRINPYIPMQVFQNNMINDIEAHLTDKIKAIPTFYAYI
jgi:hypothetical protein